MAHQLTRKKIGFSRRSCKLLLLVASLFILMGHTSCEEVKYRPGNKPTPITIQLDGYPSARYAVLFAAQSQGYLEKEGLKVTFAASANPIQPLLEDKAEFALSSQPQIITEINRGSGLVSIAALYKGHLKQIIASGNGGVARPKNLEGKKIGISNLPIDTDIVKSMVQNDGGDPSTIQFVEVPDADFSRQLFAGTLDAVFSDWYRDKLFFEERSLTVTHFDPADYGVPLIDSIDLATTSKYESQNKEQIKRLLRALEMGRDYLLANPDRAVEAVVKNQDPEYPLTPDLQSRYLKNLLDGMKAAPYGSQDLDLWTKLADWMKEKGIIGEKFNPKKAFIIFK